MTIMRKAAGMILVVIVLLLMGLGGSALALQTLTDNEMNQVAGRNAIYVGVGQGFPFHGGAGDIKLEFDQSPWLIDFIDRPNNASEATASYNTNHSYAYDPYQDDTGLNFGNLNTGTGNIDAAQVLVPVKLKMRIETASSGRPLLNIELYTEYTAWPGNEPDFIFDELSFRKNGSVPWYNDATWQEGFTLHVDGITFLSYPYHDVDDVGTTADPLNQTYTAADLAQRTPAMHLTLGSNNSEQGLVGELGLKLHLPGINFYSATNDAAKQRVFGLQGIILAGRISQPMSDEFSYDISKMDFDGEAVLGVAKAAGPPQPHSDTAADNGYDSNISANYFPLTISAVTANLGAGGTHAYLVLEACGGWTNPGAPDNHNRTVTYPASNSGNTANFNPYYSAAAGAGEIHEYLFGDVRVGRVFSKLDRVGYGGLGTYSIGEQAAVIKDINLPWVRAVFCVDARLNDILNAAYSSTTSLALIKNTSMQNGGYVHFDKVTERPTKADIAGGWGDSGAWYAPCPGYGNIWQ